MCKDIPLLTANDVELRVSQIQTTSYGTYVTLLAYKNSRVDMRILDEVFGAMNWTRTHSVIDGRLFCTVSVWDEEKQQWIAKQDVGVPSNTEATKGEASDAFKRACFNLGIGRELYSAPDIRIKLNDNEVIAGNNGKPKTYAKFFVGKDMTYDKDNNCFTSFTVLDKKGNVRFQLDSARNTIDDIHNSANRANNTEPRLATPVTSATNATVTTCCHCHATIKSPKVLEYAMSKYGKPVCYECQKKLSA